MAEQIHVAGTVHIWSGTGVAGALEELAVSQDGVTVTINTHWQGVMTDHFGPAVPYDEQYFLQSVSVEADCVWYDKTIWYKWLTAFQGPGLISGIPGSFGFAGNLAYQNANVFTLLLRTTPTGIGLTGVEDCWRFPFCVIDDPESHRLGVQTTVPRMKWKVLPTQVASASYGAPLWNFNCS